MSEITTDDIIKMAKDAKAAGQKAPAKKGNPTWKPATLLTTFNKKPGIRYRWVNPDADNVERKLAEGWKPVNKTTGATVDTPDYNTFQSEKSLDTTRTRRGMILMGLDEELGKARDEYYRKQSNDRLAGIHKDTKQSIAAAGAETTGTIVIK